jgi:hypothetical protein
VIENIHSVSAKSAISALTGRIKKDFTDFAGVPADLILKPSIKEGSANLYTVTHSSFSSSARISRNLGFRFVISISIASLTNS